MNALTATLGTIVTPQLNAGTPKGGKGKKAKQKPQEVQAPAAVLDMAAVTLTGTQVGTLASQAKVASGNAFATVRTTLAAACAMGQAGEAYEALFTAAYKVKGPKEQWLRTYKSLFGSAIKAGVVITNDMSQSDLVKATKAAKAAASGTGEGEEDGEEGEAPNANGALEMVKRMVKGALNKGATDAEVMAAVKAAIKEFHTKED